MKIEMRDLGSDHSGQPVYGVLIDDVRVFETWSEDQAIELADNLTAVLVKKVGAK